VWKGTKECLIKIGAWNGEEILHIYVVSLDLKKNDVSLSKFCICGDDKISLLPMVGYKFTIELNGKLNGV
jgi:hypothetical protein